MTGRYSVAYTSAARRQMNRLPLGAAVAIHEHLMGPVADNPRRLGKQLDAPYEGLWSTLRGEYRAIYAIDEDAAAVRSWPLLTVGMPTVRRDSRAQTTSSLSGHRRPR